MSKYTIKQLDRHNKNDYKLWKNAIYQFDGATFFHDPAFLSYHKEKFQEHHLGIFKGDALFGVMPMALFEDEKKVVAKSPYGATYGGIILLKNLKYKDAKEVSQQIVNYCKKIKITSIWYTPVPFTVKQHPDDTLMFAMMQKGMKNVAYDIDSVVRLNKNFSRNYNSRTKRNLKQINSSEMQVDFNGNLDDFWHLMDYTYKGKHKKAPTHTKQDFKYLNKTFPFSVFCEILYYKQMPIAALGIFYLNNNVKKTFYIVQDYEYSKMQGMTYLIDQSMKKAFEEGALYYNFGSSGTNLVAGENVFEYKENFGSIGVMRNKLIWELDT